MWILGSGGWWRGVLVDDEDYVRKNTWMCLLSYVMDEG